MKRFLAVFLSVLILMSISGWSLTFADGEGEGQAPVLNQYISVSPTDGAVSVTDSTTSLLVEGTEVKSVEFSYNTQNGDGATGIVEATKDSGGIESESFKISGSPQVSVNAPVSGGTKAKSISGAADQPTDVTIYVDTPGGHADSGYVYAFSEAENGGVATSNVAISGNVETDYDKGIRAITQGDGSSSAEATVTVNGDVTVKDVGAGETGIYAITSYTPYDVLSSGGSLETTVTVNGEVSATGSSATAVYAGLGAQGEGKMTVTVNVKGDVAATATNGTATGLELTDNYGISSNKNTVTVGGDVAATATGGNAAGVYASGPAPEATVSGNVNAAAKGDGAIAEAVEAYDGSEVTVKKDVSAKAEGSNAAALAVQSSVEDSHVTVNGNVTSTATGEKAGATGVNAGSKATVSISGDVTAAGEGSAIGVNAQNAGDVEIGGNLKSEADQATSIQAASKAEVTVNGSVWSSDDGVKVSGGSTVVIGSGEEEAMTAHNLIAQGGDAITVTVTNGQNAEKSTVVVEGAVSAGQNTLVLNVQPAGYQEITDTQETVNAVINNLPDIVVQTIAKDADIVVTTQNDTLSQESQDKITNAMFAQISYIVTTNNMDEAKVSIVDTKTKTVGDTTYVVAHENDTLTVKNIGNGKIVGVHVGGDNQLATVQDNGDGSWSVIVNRGGNLDFKVDYDPYAQDDAQPAQPSDSAQPSEPVQPSDPAQPAVQPVSITVTPSAGNTFTDPNLFPLHSGADSNVLRMNMVHNSKSDILVSTFRNFADQGYDTLDVTTAGGSYTVTLAELLALAEKGSLITFVINGDLLEIYVDWQLVMTLALTGART